MLQEEILRIKEKAEPSLTKIEGVTGVGVGQIARNDPIIIYVREPTRQILSELPETIDGIPVHIIKTGTIMPLTFAVPVAQAIFPTRTEHIRPVPGGYSVGHPEVTAGTLTCRAFDRQTRELYGLSNNHVIALDWGTEHTGIKGDSSLSPGPYDGGVDPTDKIGELDRWIPVKEAEDNLVDIAAFKTNSEMVTDEIEEVGKPDSTLTPYVGMKIVKSGRTSGVTYGTVIDVNATIIVSGWGDCTFKNQITMSKMLDPGDSGSWIGSQDTYQSVSVGHAGSPDISVACKATDVERLLGLEIIPPVETLPWYTVMGIWTGVLGLGQVMVGAIQMPRERGVLM